MWILRINMTDRSYRLEEVPAAYKNLGGRGMTSTIVHDEVPPLCHPLGPNNKLVFAPGIKLMESLGVLPHLNRVVFSGFGEPLTHPNILEMIEAVCKRNLAVTLGPMASCWKPKWPGN